MQKSDKVVRERMRHNTHTHARTQRETECTNYNDGWDITETDGDDAV